MRRLATLAALALLTACGKADNDQGPGGLTVGEAKALDEAAQMVDAKRLPPEAVPPQAPNSAAPNPAASAPAPSPTS